VELVSCAGTIAEEMSLQQDLKRWTRAALEHLTPDTPPAQAGWVLRWSTSWQAVLGVSCVNEARQQAIAFFRAANDRRGLSTALRTAAISIARAGDMPPDVLPMLAEAIALLRPLPPTKDLATALGHMGTVHFYNGEHEAARRYQNEAQAIRRKLGDRSGLLASALNLAELNFATGRRQEAIESAQAAAADARAGRHTVLHANLLANLSGYLLATDQVAEGEQAAREALSLNRMLCHRDWAAGCLEHLALAHALSGGFHEAAGIAGFTQGYFERTDQTRDPLEQAEYGRLMGLLQSALDKDTLAAAMADGAAWDEDTVDAVALHAAEEVRATVAA
jgi:tetratricopeptide (TPR) repeat protein